VKGKESIEKGGRLGHPSEEERERRPLRCGEGSVEPTGVRGVDAKQEGALKEKGQGGED